MVIVSIRLIGSAFLWIGAYTRALIEVENKCIVVIVHVQV